MEFHFVEFTEDPNNSLSSWAVDKALEIWAKRVAKAAELQRYIDLVQPTLEKGVRSVSREEDFWFMHE